jgi:arylsulfatase A-like enzyme
MRILFLDLDTLRPDHLGCYGYHRNTSPNIDKVASEGVRFDNYYCSDAPCLPARAALVSGKFGIRSGVVGHGGTAADMKLEGRDRNFTSELSKDSIWMFMRQHGYRTASVSPFAERHSAWWFNAGFMETFDTCQGGMESAEKVTPVALDWLERNGKNDNWLLHVNYWDPHTPYRAPAELGNPFKDDPLPSWMNEETVRKHCSMPGGHSAMEVGMFDDRENPAFPRHPGKVSNMGEFRKMIDGYDCGIRHMDNHIGMIFSKLSELGVLEDTAIIITSDHGENLGELNSYAEHGTSDNITHRIPMIIRIPGKKGNHVDRGLHYNLDLSATLAEIIGASPRKGWQGRSYSKALTEGGECGRDYLVLSQCAHSAMRSVRFGDWIYIRSIHDFYHLYPREMLFNIKDDPHEEHDLSGKHPEICGRAARMLMEWQENQMLGNPDDRDPLWTVMREGGPMHSKGRLKEYCERLNRTGRGKFVKDLKEKYPGEF